METRVVVVHDWVDYTVALGTAGAAVVALLFGVLALTADSRRRTKAVAQQARLVLVEVVSAEVSSSNMNVQIGVRNFSPFPITDVEPTRAPGTAEMQLLYTGSMHINSGIAILLSGKSYTIDNCSLVPGVGRSNDVDLSHSSLALDAIKYFGVRWVDNDGQKWERLGNSTEPQLVRVVKPARLRKRGSRKDKSA